MSFKLDCMKFEPLLLRFVLVRDECFWQIAARALTFDFMKLKLMCYSNTFSKKKSPYFLPSAIMDSERFILLSFFKKQHLVSTGAIKITKIFCDSLKANLIYSQFLHKKMCDLDGIMRTRLVKSAKIFKKHGFGQWFLVMPDS